MVNKSNLVELKYLSKAKEGMNASTLADIIDISKFLNEPNGITGMLFFDYGYFGQIIEGNRSAIEETWSRIKKDSRHCKIEFFGITEIQDRRFPKWSMNLFDAPGFATAFPQFAELIKKMHDSDGENIRILKLLWQKV